MQTVAELPKMKARSITVMGTRTQDQPLVASIVASHGLKSSEGLSEGPTTVVAGFGWHPWFSHELYDDTVNEPTYVHSEDIEAAKKGHYQKILSPKPEEEEVWRGLPAPKPLSSIIGDMRERLMADPVAIIGEIGLDKAFRLPTPWVAGAQMQSGHDPTRTPGGRERRPLSRLNIEMSHQKAVLVAQLKLAGEMGRPVSVHGVQVHGLLYDCLTSSWKGHELKGKRSQQKQAKKQYAENEDQDKAAKPFPPRICLHSFSGKSDAVKQYLKPSIPATIFYSFSKKNNFRTETGLQKAEDALKMIPDDRVLVESDLHTAGEVMDAHLEEVYRRICLVKGWSLEHGVAVIASNYRHFIFGERS
jgi:Tat protein secretion system quality control protein TatD with DNase activity